MKHTYKKYFSVAAVIVVLISAYFYNSTSFITKEVVKPKLSKEDKAKGIADMYTWQFNRLKNPTTNDIPFNMRTKELEFAKKISKISELNKNNVLTTDWFAEGPNNQGGRTKDVIEDITSFSFIK